MDVMLKSALLSDDGRYRYRLGRLWDPLLAHVVWIMCNPSIADAEVDDPTIRKCIGFSRRWGYGSITVVNLFAYRATDPAELTSAKDPRGPDNAYHLQDAMASPNTGLIVCAWGDSWLRANTSRYSVESFAMGFGVDLHCIGRTQKGNPRHPGRPGYDTKLEGYP